MSATIREDLAERHVVLADEVYERALQHAEEGSLELVEYLIREDAVDKETACKVWAKRINAAYVDPLATINTESALASIPLEIARKANAMPLYEIEGALTVAMPDPNDEALVRRLGAIADKAISPVFRLPDEAKHAIELHYSDSKSVGELIERLEHSPDATPVRLTAEELAEISESGQIIELSDALLYLAIKERASDIHIEPDPEHANVRFRIDGRLQNVFRIAKTLQPPLVSRIKVLCDLNIAETRRPQDGRFQLPLGTERVNFRVSTIPTVNGEKAVLRMLAPASQRDFKSLDNMFVSRPILAPFKRVIRSPHGMIFVTGPTGSGKSTTLYAALHEINAPENNICTIEDPVETRIEGVVQSQVNADIGVTFANMLRSLLRQDPDVILVGEIRDQETAKIATEAALTGHLVFSTLHTHNAIQAVVRLVELGVEPYLVAPSLLAVMAQRLAARICDNCKQAYAPGPELLRKYFYDADIPEADSVVFYRGAGCPQCRGTGYRGRIAFHELALITERMRALIARNAGDEELSRAAAEAGYRPLRYDGLKKVLLGFTTLEELEKQASFDLASPA